MEKIALPTRNGAVDDHFGHCECYTIFTLDADRRIADSGDACAHHHEGGCPEHHGTTGWHLAE